MMKKMELGQVNENIFPQLDLNVFYETFVGVRFPLANPSRFLTEIGDFEHGENERKGLQVMQLIKGLSLVFQ